MASLAVAFELDGKASGITTTESQVCFEHFFRGRKRGTKSEKEKKMERKGRN